MGGGEGGRVGGGGRGSCGRKEWLRGWGVGEGRVLLKLNLTFRRIVIPGTSCHLFRSLVYVTL